MQTIEKYMFNEKTGFSHISLLEAYAELRNTYAGLKNDIGVSQSNPLISNNQQRLAYILSRMPATTAVVSKILNEVESLPHFRSLNSILDLGSGTGAVLWAVMNSQLKPEKITAIDQDKYIIDLAKELAALNHDAFWQTVQWHQIYLGKKFEVTPHDLVTLSYVLIEQSIDDINQILGKIWELSNHALLVIEPGTPKGFKNILFARNYFIEKGGYIVAPCSHMELCPLRDNWCHFNERIERTYWQRKMKDAVLGYEDEPYSYLLVTKKPVEKTGERILSSPRKKSGHVILELCAPEKVKKMTITRSMKEKYKSVKKKKPGDVWN